MIKPIEDAFAGYINIRDKQLFVAINENLCKFYPRENRDEMRVFGDTPIERQFIHGFDEDYNLIALLFEQPLPMPTAFFHFGSSYLAFKTPMIVKGRRSREDEDKLDTFDALTFSSSAIDSLHPPGIQALDMEELWKIPEDGARTLKIKAFDEYTSSYSFELYGEKITLMYSVSQSGVESISGDLGRLYSIIRLEFNRPQKLETFERYYVLIKKLIAFCVGQHNIKFDKVQLNRRITTGEDIGRYKELGICEIFDTYSDYIGFDWGRTIPFRVFDCHIADVLTLLGDEENAPWLTFLPDTNEGKKWISHDNIKDLCTALEIEYDRGNFPSQKDENMREIKSVLMETVKEYCSVNNIAEDSKVKALSYVGRIDISVADRICAMRDIIKNRIQSASDEIISRTFSITGQDIKRFLELRNGITHGRLITEWGDVAVVYQRLYRIAFLAMLIRMDIPDEKLDICLEALERRTPLL